MHPINFFGLFSLLEGCAKSTHEIPAPEIQFFPDDPKEDTKAFAVDLYRELKNAGVSDGEIDRGYYPLGDPTPEGERPLGAGDGKIHEMEIYRAARSFRVKKSGASRLWGLSYREYRRAMEHQSRILNCTDCMVVDPFEQNLLKRAALQSLQRSLGLDPYSPEALLEIGLGQYGPKLKIGALRRALRLAPELDPQQLEKVLRELEKQTKPTLKTQ